MFSNRTRSAFTRTELLAAIAIVCIIAAIVYPAVSRAREKARAAECISNQRKVAQAEYQYVQDNDRGVPPTFRCEDGKERPPGNVCINLMTTRTWVHCLRPYVKSKWAFWCPDIEKDPYGQWYGKRHAIFPDYQELPAFGYNYTYLTPENGNTVGTCLADAGYVDGVNVIPVKDREIEVPAQTVLFADVKYVGADADGGYVQGWGADPPTAQDACYWGGWGVGSPGDDPRQHGVNTGTGIINPRHSGRVNVTFCDGHSQCLTPHQLAAGTNWYPGIANTSVAITDLSKFLWSLKKTGKSDL